MPQLHRLLFLAAGLLPVAVPASISAQERPAPRDASRLTFEVASIKRKAELAPGITMLEERSSPELFGLTETISKASDQQQHG